MASSYFVTFGDNRLTFPGATGSVAWEDESPVAPSVPGIVIPFAGTVSPDGYLLCDGSEVSRSTYALLYAVIGDTYGAGDGSTTFNLPDLRGRVVIGVAGTHALGSTGGEETHTLDTTELPSHLHEVPQHGHENDISATIPSMSHTLTQPAFKYIKPGSSKTSDGGANTLYNSVNNPAATRSTNAAVGNHAAADCTMSGSISDADSMSTDSIGSDSSHNNMQPFLTIQYLISTGE